MDNKKVYFQIFRDERRQSGYLKLYGENLSHGQRIILDFDNPGNLQNKLVSVMMAMELALGYRPGFYQIDDDMSNPQFAGFYSYDVRNFIWK